MEQAQGSSKPHQSAFSIAWTKSLVKIRKPVSKAVCFMSDTAARNPKATIVCGILLAIISVAVGIFTNFELEVDSDVLWTPTPSHVLSHGDWMATRSGFPAPSRWCLFQVHADGANVLTQTGIERVFVLLDVTTKTEGYVDVCSDATVAMLDENGKKTCWITSVTRHWNYSLESFQQQVQNGTNALDITSNGFYPDGTPVDETQILGSAERDASTQSLVAAKTFILAIAIPEIEAAVDLEEKLIDNVLNLQEQWYGESDNIYRAEIFTERSFDDEFSRAIVKDIPLVPMIFVLMSIFTCYIFLRRDWVYSRCMLGFGAVCSILLSIMMGYGILFTIGVPFTSMTQVVPFVMFGIGLDDAFILWGAYQRLDHSIPVLDRIHLAVEEVGVSIFMTTLTSVVAFSLGSLSSIPAVYWLCAYTAPTIAIDFVYQITFFVALIVLDERRVNEKKRDCCTCMKAPTPENSQEVTEPHKAVVDRFMIWYSNILMKPISKAIIVVLFSGFFGGMLYSTTLLEQRFEFTDVLPSPSYVGDFWETYAAYTGGTRTAPFVTFRGVNQSDPAVQDQMSDFLTQIVSMDEIKDPPEFFWLDHFQEFSASNQTISSVIETFTGEVDPRLIPHMTSDLPVSEILTTLSATDQLDIFLTVPKYNQLFRDHIVRDTDGSITASRTQVRMSEIDRESVVAQVDALEEQRLISEAQDINANLEPEDWNFFTFDELYYIWQFYSDSPRELVLTTILGVSAVSFISLVFIPHWSSVLFVSPMISILYVDLLGFLQMFGIAINAVSYISLAMSIGLMVDFLLHILLRYFESKETTREAKVKDVLRTMGTSILIGGVSTFLGVLPLVFASSNVFFTIFICFLGLVIIGISHGLILLPVILSLVGPVVVLEL